MYMHTKYERSRSKLSKAIELQTDTEADRKTDRQTDRQTHTHTVTHTVATERSTMPQSPVAVNAVIETKFYLSGRRHVKIYLS